MAIFSNQATLTYNGTTTNSNIAYGEILDVLVATKTAVEGAYTPGELVTYVVTLRNTGAAPLTGITLTDDLGGYIFNADTVYPLTYEADSAALFVDVVPQGAPAVTAGPPLVISGITVPAGGDTVIVYQARVNSFASPEAGSTIVNTATVTGGGLSVPLTAQETITVAQMANPVITKALDPMVVPENGQLTYTFTIRNYGNTPLVATDDVVLSDALPSMESSASAPLLSAFCAVIQQS
jgi:uncharacterized repeat protein (TIGR01451 family)